MQKRNSFLIIAALSAGVVLGGRFFGDIKTKPESVVKITEYDWIEDYSGVRKIKGYGFNNSDSDISGARIIFDFYDINGNRVDNQAVPIGNIQAYKPFIFEFIVFSEEAVDVKVKEIQTY